MGHVGLTPQSATKLGGFKAQGRSAEAALTLLADARALEAAGCFSLVLEAVPAPVAKRISERLAIPTIGIGAGADTDGQVLVWHDLLGLYEGRVAALREALRRHRRTTIRDALEAYADDVRERRFPEEQHTYAMPDEELAVFERAAGASDHEHEEGHDRSHESRRGGDRARACAASPSRGRRGRRARGARATRRRTRVATTSRTVSPAPSSAPPARNVSPP